MASVRTAGHPAQWPPHIRERYGVRDRSPWATVALVAAGLLFLALVTVVGWRLSNPAVDAGVLSYQAVSDERMTIGFEVQRRASTPVTCVLRARGQDGFDVGYAVVALPTDSGRTQHVFELRTAYRGRRRRAPRLRARRAAGRRPGRAVPPRRAPARPAVDADGALTSCTRC